MGDDSRVSVSIEPGPTSYDWLLVRRNRLAQPHRLAVALNSVANLFRSLRGAPTKAAEPGWGKPVCLAELYDGSRFKGEGFKARFTEAGASLFVQSADIFEAYRARYPEHPFKAETEFVDI